MRKNYPSDLTDKQWEKISHIFIASKRGRPRTIDAREVVNAILYVMKNGCAWRSLPHDFPAWQTVYVQRMRWTMSGLLTQAQLMLSPKSPPVGIIDSTFIESAYGGGFAKASGYKRATGHSIHVVIDKASTPLAVFIQPANIHDAQAARIIIPALKYRHPSIVRILGDKAYKQKPLVSEMEQLGVFIDGSSPSLPKGCIFKPLPLRWKVEQFFAWLSKWRRIAKNWCFTINGFTTDVAWSLLGLQLRRAISH